MMLHSIRSVDSIALTEHLPEIQSRHMFVTRREIKYAGTLILTVPLSTEHSLLQSLAPFPLFSFDFQHSTDLCKKKAQLFNL